MENKHLTANELLDLINECLYAFIIATDRKQEKQQAKNIKQLKKTLKVLHKKKVVFDKETLLFRFKK